MEPSQRRHRRSIRLKGYDYTLAGAYFVTICTQDRACLFGDVTDGAMRLNDPGVMMQAIWDEIPTHYPGVDIDAFIVMPNHIHGIIVLTGDPVRALGQPRWDCPYDPVLAGTVAPAMSLADVVHRFMTLTTKRYTDGVKQLDWPAYRGRLWLRNYYEHIIRDEISLDRIRQYIADNPAGWALDAENPARSAPRGGGACQPPVRRA